MKQTIENFKPYNNLFEYLEESQVKFECISHPRTISLEDAATVCCVPKNAVLRAVLLQEEQGLLMAILPIDRLLDFSCLCQMLNREFRPCEPDKIIEIFQGKSEKYFPPLPNYFGLDAIIDQSILSQEFVYFEPSNHEVLIKISRQDYLNLLENVWQGDFSCLISELANVDHDEELDQKVEQFTPKRFKQRIKENLELPALPPIANQILMIRSNPDATASDLADVISQDPSLSAQLIKWAQSPYYSYGGTITSIECAIIKVLGFDLVMNLALGIALNNAMQVPVNGPLGLKSYWKFSVYTALLAEKLSLHMPAQNRPIRGLVYLSGLLHNFGQLILAQLFPSQYFILNHYIELNPHICLTQVEKHLLGVTHTEIGGWLLESWNLPKEVLTAVKEHHEENDHSEYQVYSNLVFLATHLLKSIDIGDAQNAKISEELLETLQLDSECVLQALQEVQDQEDALDQIVNQLT